MFCYVSDCYIVRSCSLTSLLDKLLVWLSISSCLFSIAVDKSFCLLSALVVGGKTLGKDALGEAPSPKKRRRRISERRCGGALGANGAASR